MRIGPFARVLILIALCGSTIAGISAGVFSYTARAEGEIGQRPVRWEGICARCGEGHTMFGSQRPFKSKCDRYDMNTNTFCNGGIIWQPIFQ